MIIDFSNFMEYISFQSIIIFRFLGFLMNAPFFREKFVNRRLKILFLFLIVLLLPINTKYPIKNYDINILVFFENFFIGIFVGMIFNILFYAIQIVGETLSIKMGVSFLNTFGINNFDNSYLISRLFKILLLLVFLSLNMHLIIITYFYKLFYIDLSLSKTISIFMNMSYDIYYYSIIILLPILIILIIINFIIGMISRLVPQFSIFVVGLSLNLFGGFIAIIMIASSIPFFGEKYFVSILDRFLYLLSD